MIRRDQLKVLTPLAVACLCPAAAAAETSVGVPPPVTSPPAGFRAAPLSPPLSPPLSSQTAAPAVPVPGAPAPAVPAPPVPTPGLPAPAPTAPAPTAPAPTVPAPAPAVPGLPAPTTPTVPEPLPAPTSPLGIPGTEPPGGVFGTVVSLQFTGLNRLSREVFASRLQTRVGTAFSRAAADQDAQAIYGTGYFYSVTPRVDQGPNGVTVTFDLIENPLITTIDIEGTSSIMPKATLLNAMLTKPNQVLNRQIVHSDLTKIEDIYAGQGYIYAKVLDAKVVDADTRTNTGVLRIVVGEGVVDAIRIVGNKKTKPFVILRAIKTKPGSVFKLNRWRDDLKAIARLNIFSDIRYDATTTELGKIVLIVNVVEQRTGNVNFGFGYNTREKGVVFVDLADTNFRGRAESVDANLELGGYQTRGSYRFSFYEPWLGKTDYSAGASLYKQQTDRIVPGSNGNSVDGRYLEDRTGESLTTGRHLSDTDQVLMVLKNEAVSSNQIYGNVVSITGGSVVSSSSNVSPFLLQSGRIASAGFQYAHDDRDNPLNPRMGSFDQFMLEPGSGTFENPGDTGAHPFNYLRFTSDLRKFFPVGKLVQKEGLDVQKVLALHLLYGRSSPGIPAFQYFFMGGADTLRGYQEDNFFGENMFLLSTELRIPVALNKLQFVTFVDAGDAWGGNYTPNRSFKLYPAVGVGLRVVIPQIGPLRLDYGYGSFGGRPDFSIGQAF